MSAIVVVINIVFVYVYVVVAQDIVNGSVCWNGNVQRCNILANLTRDDVTSKSFLVNFNCSGDVDQLAAQQSYGFNRQIRDVQTIELNGCNVTRNDTIGVEHIDDPSSVTHLTIDSFKLKTFYSKHLDKFKSLVTLKLIDNVLDEIINKSFQDILTVEVLDITNNNLKMIAPHAVVPLNHLKSFTLIEPNLSIDELVVTFCFELKHLRLAVNKYQWQPLPNSTETFEMFDTKLTFPERSFGLESCANLTRMTITHSQWNDFPAVESSSLKVLNLTQNNLLQLTENFDLPNLQILDISGNEIKEINADTFKSMERLSEMYASNNRIERIAKGAFDSNNQLEVIQISGNRLKSMEFTDHLAEQPLRIFIDENPWSCLWVLHVSSEQPTIFAIFQYNKFTHKLNVEGLNCLYYEMDRYTMYDTTAAAASTETIPFSSTFNSSIFFDNTIEKSYRRHPKDTAMITLIILAVGVTVLFFLLYLHIKCRENTPEPFYRSLPYDAHQMSDRIDIIRRHLPPTDYEAPIVSHDPADLKEVIYEQIPEKFTNYERIPERFTVHDGCGFDDVNSVRPYQH